MVEEREQVKTVSSSIGNDRGRLVAEVSQKVFGEAPERIAFPGGRGRDTFIADMGDTSWVFTKRDTAETAQMEARVLMSLDSSNVTPKFKAIADCWTVQEYVPGARLPVILDQTADMSKRIELVEIALEALLKIQNIGGKEGLSDSLPAVSGSMDWLHHAINAGAACSKMINIKPLKVDVDALAAVLVGERDAFVKFDARPGNALMDGSRTVWFDWEDCGRGKAVEDLAFLICDEWCALDAAAEDYVIDTLVGDFASDMSKIAAMRHLVLYGTLHMAQRMQVCLTFHMQAGGWSDRPFCLENDKAGNTFPEMARLSERLMRWADRFPETRGFVDWNNEIRSFLRLDETNRNLLSAIAA